MIMVTFVMRGGHARGSNNIIIIIIIVHLAIFIMLGLWLGKIW